MTREDHKARLVMMFKMLHKLAQMVELKPVDVLGVRGFNGIGKHCPISLNELKSQWYNSGEHVARVMYYGMRPTYVRFTNAKFSPDELKLIDSLASIEYAKKTREVWYNTWDSSCPRFSVKEIENAFGTQTLLSLEVLERLFGNAG